MRTPIFDFLSSYGGSSVTRFHMPGHKGHPRLGIESLDITEIKGADVLYSADGIIAESRENARALFGTGATYYSTEGSTLAIKAMLATALRERTAGSSRTILAARNVHRAFINATALLDLDVEWIYPKREGHLVACDISADDVVSAIGAMKVRPFAVYITSPDYLGNMQDVKGIAEALSRYDIPLLVDNAHGAYLAFLDEDSHPISLGAAMCADSAHKTLPVLTGGAYLHVSKRCSHYIESASDMLSLFASTSPSYLTLASLDLCNAYIDDGYKEKLRITVAMLDAIKEKYSLRRDIDPLKLVIDRPIADELREYGIECEFSDDEYTVLMITPDNTDDELSLLDRALCELLSVENRVEHKPQAFLRAERAMSIRDAVLSKHESVPVGKSVGRVLSTATVSCPPAVPIAVSGEVITEAHVSLFERYGIDRVEVVKN